MSLPKLLLQLVYVRKLPESVVGSFYIEGIRHVPIC
nr:MAG TPA: hypothetical protein [Caudoviricetes sp.]